MSGPHPCPPPLAAFTAAGITGLEAFTDADAALARIAKIYDKGVRILREAFARFTEGELPVEPVERLLSVPRPRARPRAAEPRCPALLRRAPRARHLWHDADPARPLRRATTKTRSATSCSITTCRCMSASATGRSRFRSSSRRASPTSADAGRARCRRTSPLPDLAADRRRDRQRHLRGRAGQAQAARPLHRRAGRLLARTPAALHRHLARAFSRTSCC